MPEPALRCAFRPLHQFRYERSPSGLMACTQTPASVAVEVLMEQQRIRTGIRACTNLIRAPAVGTDPKQARKTPGQFLGDRLKGHEMSRPGGTLHGETSAQDLVKPLQRLNQKVVDGEPDWSTPVGIAAEQAGTGLARFISNSEDGPVQHQRHRLLGVGLGQRANPIG